MASSLPPLKNIPKKKFLINGINRVVLLRDIYSAGDNPIAALCGLTKLEDGQPYPEGATDIKRLSEATTTGILRRGYAVIQVTDSTTNPATVKSARHTIYMSATASQQIGALVNCSIGTGEANSTITSAYFPTRIRLG